MNQNKAGRLITGELWSWMMTWSHFDGHKRFHVLLSWIWKTFSHRNTLLLQLHLLIHWTHTYHGSIEFLFVDILYACMYILVSKLDRSAFNRCQSVSSCKWASLREKRRFYWQKWKWIKMIGCSGARILKLLSFSLSFGIKPLNNSHQKVLVIHQQWLGRDDHHHNTPC